MNKQEFYNAVEEILHSGHQYKEPWINPRYSGRWDSRKPGNGRFQGYGVVRWFNKDFVQVNMHHPYLCTKNYTAEDTLLYLANVMEFYRIDQIETVFDELRLDNNGLGFR